MKKSLDRPKYGYIPVHMRSECKQKGVIHGPLKRNNGQVLR